MLACIVFQSLPPLDAALNDRHLDGAVVCASVTDLDGHLIFEKNAQTRVVPASNQKLLSSSFALWAFRPTFRPETYIWQEPDQIIVETSGNPTLTFTQVQDATRKLNHTLPVFVKESYSPGVPPGWELDDLPNKYAAPVTALTLDRGSYELWADKGRPLLLPAAYGQRINFKPGKQTLSMSYDPIRRILNVSGTLPKAKTRLDTLALSTPDVAMASLLGSRFERTNTVPTRKPDVVISGSTIAETLEACLPPSDNNLAEHLLLMAAQQQGELGNAPYETATTRLKNFLTRTVGVPASDISPADGSGMGRQNLVTTRALTTLLGWANKQPTASIWRASLARPGKGTLAKRLTGIPFEGKTGSLTHVASLSGYLRTKAGKDVIVSVVLNNFACSATEARVQIDLFIENLFQTLA